MPQPNPSTVSVRQVAGSLFTLVDSESGPAGQANIRNRTKKFLADFGDRPIENLPPDDLIRFKSELAKSHYSPEYTNNCLSAVRRLLTFAWETGKVSQPFRIKLILKNVPKGVLKRRASHWRTSRRFSRLSRQSVQTLPG